MSAKRPALPLLRVLLTFWVAAACWLVPATGQPRATTGGVREVALAELVQTVSVRAPERVAPATLALSSVRPHVGGPSPMHVAARMPARVHDAQPARAPWPSITRDVPRDSRLDFPTEATPPPSTVC